jgi:cell division protein FtsB
MSWFTDARVQRLERQRAKLLAKLRERNGTIMVIERMRAAAQDRADRRQKLLEERDAEIESLRAINTALVHENDKLRDGLLPETVRRPQMAIYPPEPAR